MRRHVARERVREYVTTLRDNNKINIKFNKFRANKSFDKRVIPEYA